MEARCRQVGAGKRACGLDSGNPVADCNLIAFSTRGDRAESRGKQRICSRLHTLHQSPLQTDCLPKGKALCTAHPFDEQTVCGQQSGAMAAEARRLADELESAAAAMDRIGKQLGAPYCER